MHYDPRYFLPNMRLLVSDSENPSVHDELRDSHRKGLERREVEKRIYTEKQPLTACRCLSCL